jgi:hypothetical protein
MLPNRRNEYLDLRPAANLLLDVLAQRLRTLDPDLVVQPAGASPWTAYYHRDKLISLARPAARGTAGAIDVALLPVPKAGTAVDARSLDEPQFAEALAEAVRLAPTTSPDAGVSFGPYGDNALAAILFVTDVVVAVSSELERRRAAAGITAASDPNASRAILESARREARRRSNSLALGCLGAILGGFGLVFVAVGLASFLVAAGAPDWAAMLLFLLIPLGGWLPFFWIRRRYPSAPQTRFARIASRLVLLAGALLVGGFIVWVVGSIAAPPPVTAEQAAWCLGPGSGYLDNAVGVIAVDPTWTDATAADDPNFRRACSLAWDATHP